MSSSQHNICRRRNSSNWMKGFGWGLYDIATSGYFLVFPLYLFPLYLSTRVFANYPGFELYWGLAQGLAVFLAVIAGLVLGKALDSRGLVHVAPKAIVVAPVVSSLLPLLIAFRASPFVLLGGYVLVQSTYLLSLTIYDASLVRVAQPGGDRAVVSGWAWGWGYIGGLACMGMMELGLHFYPRYSAWDFGVGVAFFLCTSLVAARWLYQTLNEQRVVDVDLRDVHVRPDVKERTPWRLLLAMILVVDGISVFMSYTGLYGTNVLHLSERQMTSMLGMLQILAFPLTGIVATLGSRNVPRTLIFCGIGWLLTAVLLVSATGNIGMFVTILTVSGVVGSTQALLRALYSDCVPSRQSIEGFGKYAVAEKGAAFLGPVIAGTLIPFVGYKTVMFTSGAAVLFGVLLIWILSRQGSANRRSD